MNTLLKNKHILVDTCVLSELFKNPTQFTDLLTIFEDVQCVLCVNGQIYLEFIRIARNKDEKEKVEYFLKTKFFELPDSEGKVLGIAKDLYPLYSFCGSIANKGQVSTVDAINAAFLKKFNKNLYLITLDNNDYPLEFLDRIHVGAIDIGKKILTWGIYGFNKDKHEILWVKYNGGSPPHQHQQHSQPHQKQHGVHH